MRPSMQSRAVAEVPNILRPHHPPVVVAGISGLIGLVCLPHLTSPGYFNMDWYRPYQAFLLLDNKLIAPLCPSHLVDESIWCTTFETLIILICHTAVEFAHNGRQEGRCLHLKHCSLI